MYFNSFAFAGFFACIYVLYVISMRRRRAQNVLLLIGSYYFYGCWDWRFLSLILISTLVDYFCALAIDRNRPALRGDPEEDDEPQIPVDPSPRAERSRRAFLLLSVCVNLGVLGFFKYYDFFAMSLSEFLGQLGLHAEPRVLNIILPVGISFYTFQTMSYTIDVYRGQLRAHRSLLDFAVFVAFFPQLVAGPILRAKDFLPQVAEPRRFDTERAYAGGYLILWGLFKKVVVADNLARLVDWGFSSHQEHFGGILLVAVYAFAIQIYCDFSGYTDIARGCAAMMGFRIPENFHLPYFATNPVEFWRRWHITLSSWLRDYLYIPLGGNRRGKRRTAINLMLTMLLGGLWHGAAWTFVAWGAYQGLLLIGYKLIEPTVRMWKQREPSLLKSLLQFLAIVVFFHLTCLGWLIFRSQSLTQAAEILQAIATPWPWWILAGANTWAGTGLFTLAAFASPVIAMQLLQHYKRDMYVLLRAPAYIRGFVYAALFYGIVGWGVGGDTAFIYFQF